MTASERPEPPGVFLAFASEDSPRALSLDASLRASGARTAFDESEEPDEELPSEVVLQDLGACDGFVLVWSRHTAEDDGVSELRRLAASFDKPCFVRSLDATPAPEDVDGRIPAEDDDAAATAAVHRLLGAQPPVSAPRPHLSVEPGRWQITSDAQHGETLDLELTGADGSGPLTGVHRRAGVEGNVTGHWRSYPEEGRLDLDLESSFGLRPQHSLRQLQLLGGTNHELTAEDLHGIATVLRYRLVRD
ncbi:hypothetical protein GCM10009839_90920 [Catenulispora yoronensis]|uniref:TIR domain-containing protein n=1 Tax=Catenulispora yoronensis TaxID=450799 RepID=A0ABN2VL41_9ACTN